MGVLRGGRQAEGRRDQDGPEQGGLAASPPEDAVVRDRREAPSDLGLRVSDWKNASLRWFSDPSVHDYLHITIGTPEEAVALLKAAKAVL